MSTAGRTAAAWPSSQPAAPSGPGSHRCEREPADTAPAWQDLHMGDQSFYGAEQARIHHRGFGELARRAGELLRTRLLAAGHRDGTVVDLGCGSGILARQLTDAGYTVLGVDISPGM